MSLGSEYAPAGGTTVRTGEPGRMEVTLQPEKADAIIE
jgi:hypothetical protein